MADQENNDLFSFPDEQDLETVVPDTLQVTPEDQPVEPEIIQFEREIIEGIEAESDIDLEDVKEPSEPTVTLPYQERQESEEEAIDERNSAAYEFEKQLANIYKIQGLTPEQITQKIKDNHADDLYSSAGGGSRLITTDPTNAVFRIHLEAAEAAAREDETWYDAVKTWASDNVDPATLIEARSLMEQGILEETDEAKTRISELLVEGKTQQEAFEQTVAELDSQNKVAVQRKLTDYQKELRDLGLFEVSDDNINDASMFAGLAGAYISGKKGLLGGAAFGKKIGGPYGAALGGLGGAAFMGAGGYALTSMAVNQGLVGRFNYQPEDGPVEVDFPLLRPRQTMQYQFALGQAILDDLGYVEDIDTFLEIAPAAAKAEFITRMIGAADQYGVTESIRKKPSFVNFVKLAGGDPELIDKIIADPDANKQLKVRAALKKEGITLYSGPLASLTITQMLFHPEIRKIFRETLEKAGLMEKEIQMVEVAQDTFGLGANLFAPGLIADRDQGEINRGISGLLSDIISEISATDQYREEKAASRQAALETLKQRKKLESRERKISFTEKDLIARLENIEDGLIDDDDFDRSLFLNQFIDSHSWNTAHPDWRGEQPSVEVFSDFVKAHLKSGGKQDFVDPLLANAISSVKNGDPKEEIQKYLNEMNFRFLSQLGVGGIRVWNRPSFESVESFGRSLTERLQKERGRGASKEAQRSLQTLMYEKGYGTLYEPTAFSKLLGWAAIAPTTGAETDFVLPDAVRPLFETLGLPYGTPAGMDFEENLGLRPINSTQANRVKGRRTSMTGGFQIGLEEVQLARGFSRDDPEFNRYSAVGFVLDLLNVEKYASKSAANAARMAANVPSAAAATFKSGTPQTRAILARNELLKRTSFDQTQDPVVTNHQALKVGAQQDVNNGIDPLSSRLSAADRDLFEDVAIAAGRDPAQIYQAVALASKQGKSARTVSNKIKRAMGPNELLVLRADPEYKRVKNDVYNLVRTGKIEPTDAARFMSILEHQAIKTADIPESPYKSAQEVIAGLDVVTNRPAGAGARFMGKGLEEVDTATQDVFSQPLARDNTPDRIRAIMDDLDIEETDAAFLKNIEKNFGKKHLDELAENERIALKEQLFAGRIKPTPKPKPKLISNKKIAQLQKRYESGTAGGAPEVLTRTNRSKKEYKFKPVAKKTNIDNAAENFARGDEHRALTRGRNPIIENADWNTFWGGITGTKQVLEPPLKVRTYANPEKLAAELKRLTPEQKRRADTGIALVDELGVLYETGRAEAKTTAQLIAWTTLSRSLSAFPHESAFLDIFLNAPPASVFSLDFDAFIQSALDGNFGPKTLQQFDIWVGGIHRRRVADELLSEGEINKNEYTFLVGRDKSTIDSLVDRKIISDTDAKDFLIDPLPNTEANKTKNRLIARTMASSRKLAESLRTKELITGEEFQNLVGFHPALRVDGMGNNAAANLRSLGQNFLRQSGDRFPENKTLVGFEGRQIDVGNKTKLQAFHDILLDQSISGQEARRLFHQIYQNSGVDNKVVSFMLLAAGRKDVVVIDRIQANHFWGAAENLLGRKVLRKDGSQIDLYEGFSKPDFRKLDGGSVQSWAQNPRPYSSTRGLANVLSGARGALLYEAIEDLLARNIDEAYRLAGREGQGSLGRLHWETWVINSGQEVGHDTLNVVLRQAQGYDDPAVGSYVSEGKFQLRRYGMKYAVLPNGEQTMVVATKDGENFLFNPESWGNVIEKLTKDAANVGPGLDLPRVVPKGWRLENEKFANTPWYHRASVDRDNLDVVIRKFGTRATDEQNLALKRYAGGAGRGRTNTPRVNEAAINEVEFVESKNYSAFEEAKNKNSRPENLDPKSLEDYEGSRIFITESENAGFLVKNGDLQNVFNNSNVRGLGSEIVKLAVEEYGARTLDCFDGFLPKFYSKAGFEEVARIPFVDEFAPAGWDFFRLGRPDIVIMAYRGGDANLIRSNYGRFEYRRTNTRLTDFGEAQELARRSVRDSGDPRGMEGVGARKPRRGVGEQPLRSRVGEDKTPDNVEPTVVRLVDPDSTDTKYQRKSGVPLGYFEYDQRTRIAIINLFEKGDLDTLWHENGHFMAALMGEKYKNTLFKIFDHEVDNNGSRKLTDLGHEQFAEAWRYYRRVRDNPNGYLRRLLDELWISLHNFWSGLRRKPGLLPDEVRQYWDLEFGELPKDRRSVQTATTGAAFKRPRIVRRTIGDPDDAEVSRAQMRVAKDLGFDSNTIRSLLGDRVTRQIIYRPDLQTTQGRQRRLQRTVESTYLPRDYDAVDAGLEIYALIKNTDFRKKLVDVDMAVVGTGRYQVSKNILNRIKDHVSIRMIEALGTPFEELQKQIYQPGPNGRNALANRSTLPVGVTTRDVAAFQKRLFADQPQRDPQEYRSTTSFLLLNERQQAGMKVLLREIGNEPEADLIPFSMLDPDANLKLISVKEYNIVRDVLTDITATPLNRRNRNMQHPGHIRAFAEIFADRETLDGFAEVLKDMADFFGKRPTLDRSALDPKLVGILEGGARKMAGSAEELIKYANSQKFAPNDTLFNFFQTYVDGSTPRVNLANLNALEQIHNRLSGLVRAMDEDAAARVKSQPATGTTKPVTKDPVKVGGALDLNYLGKRLPVIQQLLDDVFGMTRMERDALTVVQSTVDQMNRGKPLNTFTAAERTTLAEAIDIIHTGINEKYQYVQDFSKRIYEYVLAVENVTEGAYRPKYAYKIYEQFYTGKFKELFEMVDSLQRVRKTKSVRRSYGLGLLNNILQVNLQSVSRISNKRKQQGKKVPGVFSKMLGAKLPEYEQRIVSLLVLLKMDEVKHQIARELAEYGFDTSRRNLVDNLGISSDITMSREKYIDRVQYYVNRILDFTDMGIQKQDVKGKKVGPVEMPVSPRENEAKYYGPTEKKENFRLDPHIVSEMDLTAAYEAQQIVSRLGIKIGRGTLEVVRLGDREFYLPKVAVDYLEDFTLQNFPRTRFKKTWGEKGRVAYELTGEKTNAATQKIAEAASSMSKVLEFFVSPRAFYHGLLIGVGGIPMVGYGMGVFIGGLSQVHFGRGTKAALDAAIAAPGTLAEASPGLRNVSEALRSEIGFNAGVLARVHGRGSAKPKTKPLILDDGRIITADMMAEALRKYGIKSAFVDVLKNPDLYDNLWERFNKTNPELANTIIFGAAGAPYGVTSASLSAALGYSFGAATKPGNIFSKAHRAYAEAFSAIDTYLRIKVLTGFLQEGRSLEDAAPRVRDIMLDYSAMSDAERNMIARYFAFWSYFSQANKLFFKTVVENPDRVIAQLKLIKSTQQSVTEGRDPDKFLAPWDKYRTMIPFKIEGQNFRVPFLIGGDTTGMLSEAFTVFNPFDVTSEERRKAALAVTGRLSPQIGLGIATLLNIDPGLGFPLDRATLQVPAELIHMDELLFGRGLSDFLEVEYIPPEKIKYIFDDPEEGKKRINLKNIEHPGRGIYVSKSPAKYYYLMNYLQSPVTGRMGDNMWALSRANAGPIETFVDALEYVKVNYSPDKPIMKNFGALNALEFVGFDIPDEDLIDPSTRSIDDPVIAGQERLLTPLDIIEGMGREEDSIRPGEQITTAPIDLLKKLGVAVRNEDGSYEVYTDRFYWTELGRVFGFTALPGGDKERPVVMEKRRHAKSSAQKARDQEAKTNAAIRQGTIRDLSESPDNQ